MDGPLACPPSRARSGLRGVSRVRPRPAGGAQATGVGLHRPRPRLWQTPEDARPGSEPLTRPTRGPDGRQRRGPAGAAQAAEERGCNKNRRRRFYSAASAAPGTRGADIRGRKRTVQEPGAADGALSRLPPSRLAAQGGSGWVRSPQAPCPGSQGPEKPGPGRSGVLRGAGATRVGVGRGCSLQGAGAGLRGRQRRGREAIGRVCVEVRPPVSFAQRQVVSFAQTGALQPPETPGRDRSSREESRGGARQKQS